LVHLEEAAIAVCQLVPVRQLSLQGGTCRVRPRIQEGPNAAEVGRGHAFERGCSMKRDDGIQLRRPHQANVGAAVLRRLKDGVHQLSRPRLQPNFFAAAARVEARATGRNPDRGPRLRLADRDHLWRGCWERLFWWAGEFGRRLWCLLKRLLPFSH
jgi:hypothetical protein